MNWDLNSTAKPYWQITVLNTAELWHWKMHSSCQRSCPNQKTRGLQWVRATGTEWLVPTKTLQRGCSFYQNVSAPCTSVTFLWVSLQKNLRDSWIAKRSATLWKFICWRLETLCISWLFFSFDQYYCPFHNHHNRCFCVVQLVVGCGCRE